MPSLYTSTLSSGIKEHGRNQAIIEVREITDSGQRACALGIALNLNKKLRMSPPRRGACQASAAMMLNVTRALLFFGCSIEALTTCSCLNIFILAQEVAGETACTALAHLGRDIAEYYWIGQVSRKEQTSELPKEHSPSPIRSFYYSIVSRPFSSVIVLLKKSASSVRLP